MSGPWKILPTAFLAQRPDLDTFLPQVVWPWLQELTANIHRFEVTPWIEEATRVIEVTSTRWAYPGAPAEIQYYAAGPDGVRTVFTEADGSKSYVRCWSFVPVEPPAALMMAAPMNVKGAG